MEPAHELLVEHGDLAVEHQDVGPQHGDPASELAEPGDVVDRVAGDQADAGAVLVGDDAPTVRLFLVHPTVTVKGRAGQG